MDDSEEWVFPFRKPTQHEYWRLDPRLTIKSGRTAPPLDLIRVPTRTPREVHHDILRVLICYDIWYHPLTAEEVFEFLPLGPLAFADFREQPEEAVTGGICRAREFLSGRRSGKQGRSGIRGGGPPSPTPPDGGYLLCPRDTAL
jgi:hypothetical protein